MGAEEKNHRSGREAVENIAKAVERIADVLEYFAENGVEISNATYTTTKDGREKTKAILFIIENL